MATRPCACCGSAEAAFVLALRGAAPAADGWQRALCLECLCWLEHTVGEVRADGDTGLLASPSGGGRAMVFADQCQVCRVPTAAPLSIVADLPRAPWAKLLVCTACAAWVGSLAGAGASARGRSFRVIDGRYGEWPHPNLRSLTVDADIGDFAARAAVETACTKMGVAIERGGSVLIVEASNSGYARQRTTEDGTRRQATVVLTTIATESDLRGALRAGASDWLTLPVTPQQVSGALTRALRGQRITSRDDATLLPRIVTLPALPEAILFEALPGTTPFQAAWLCRRFARGYDDLGAYADTIALFARAPSTDLPLVRERLGGLLRGRVRVRAGDQAPTPARFEAAG
ncbi:MAG: hypothetical protein IT302_06015 [Dehalococcoidia bacterium]|nr:hypothetical protein [Dehalococcoidia bacterium]